MDKDIRGAALEIIYLDEQSEMPDFKKMDPKQYKATIDGEWGKDDETKDNG